MTFFLTSITFNPYLKKEKMKKKLIFATNNQGKVNEVKLHLVDSYDILTLKEIGFEEELQEDFDTLQENAAQKANFIFEKYGIPCFSEDSGLEIDALDGKPGVHTAHYSGSRDRHDNMDLVLSQMQGKTNRRAQFRAVICLRTPDETHFFEGICKGTIAEEKSVGQHGFGYDPIFTPEGYEVTFADMEEMEKKKFSHRGNAMKKMIQFFKEQITDNK
jgi:XTP/dITP diphosphohydrolase